MLFKAFFGWYKPYKKFVNNSLRKYTYTWDNITNQPYNASSMFIKKI